MRLSAQTGRRLLGVAGIYLAGAAVLVLLVRGIPGGAGDLSAALVPTVVLLAFLFETIDSAAGMGFGTALAPLLFVLGYAPLEVLAFLAIGAAGVKVDLALLPSLWLGAFPAAVLSPYAVRVLPNQVWRYLVPLYAVGIAGVSLFRVFAGSE